MIVDLRPYYAGTEHIGFSPTMQALLAPSAKRREVFASRMKGKLHPSTNRSENGLRDLVPTFLFVEDSANEFILCFLMWPLQRQQRVFLCNCLVGAIPYSHCATRSLLLCGVRVLYPAQYNLTRPPS